MPNSPTEWGFVDMAVGLGMKWDIYTHPLPDQPTYRFMYNGKMYMGYTSLLFCAVECIILDRKAHGFDDKIQEQALRDYALGMRPSP